MTSTLPNESVLIRVPFEKPHNSKTRLDVLGDGRFSPPVHVRVCSAKIDGKVFMQSFLLLCPFRK